MLASALWLTSGPTDLWAVPLGQLVLWWLSGEWEARAPSHHTPARALLLRVWGQHGARVWLLRPTPGSAPAQWASSPLPGSVPLLSEGSQQGWILRPGNAWCTVGAQQAVAASLLPLPRQLPAPRRPSAPSRLLGVILALMTLNSELLTWEFIEAKHRSVAWRHINIVRLEVGLCQHYLGQLRSPEVLCVDVVRLRGGAEGTGHPERVQDTCFSPAPSTSS